LSAKISRMPPKYTKSFAMVYGAGSRKTVAEWIKSINKTINSKRKQKLVDLTRACFNNVYIAQRQHITHACGDTMTEASVCLVLKHMRPRKSIIDLHWLHKRAIVHEIAQRCYDTLFL